MIIVDDEAELREGISNYFPWDSLGIQVAGIFENGRTAFAYLKAHQVDIVLTDIRMPLMGGLELIEHAKEISPSTCYVILSGYREFEYAKKGLLLGVKDYIVKPTKYSQIYQVFSRITAELDCRGTARQEDARPSSCSQGQQGEERSVVSSVKTFIRAHYDQVTLESAAEYVRLNPYYLSTYFKQQTGEKFSDYLLRVKMEAAASLLERGTQNIKEIGEAVGYTNPNSFARAFRQYYNCNPKEYRRKKLGL